MPPSLLLLKNSLPQPRNSLTEQYWEAGGSSSWRQGEENRFFALCQAGLKPLNLLRKNQKISGFRDAQRQKYSVLIKSPKFIYGDS
jgi:hypothetical protein